MSKSKDILNVGVLGLGTVGGGVVSALQSSPELFDSRAGKHIKVVGACVRNPKKNRSAIAMDFPITSNPLDIVEDPTIDLVLELIGGLEPARKLVLTALNNGKNVVTANKALLALHGEEIFRMAEEKNCFVGYEAAVAGGIPIIKVIREGLVANKITKLHGIINGTCNYILTGMEKHQSAFDDILAEAQKKGFAEEDPSFDIGGIDAAHKLTILASLLFNVPLDFNKISVIGISDVELEDINYAKKLGYKIKHLAVAEKSKNGVELRVAPALVPETDMLSKVDEEMNAIRLEGNMLGTLLMSGAGAGAGPTASSVLSDIVDSIRNSKLERASVITNNNDNEPTSDMVVTAEQTVASAFYYRLVANNEPGMLASITNILAANKISIEAVIQDEDSKKADRVPILIVTEKIKQRQADATRLAMSEMPGILSPVKQFRVQKDD